MTLRPPLPRSVLVTGASGFLGRRLVQVLREGGVEVRGVDRVADPACGVVAGDVTEPAGWAAAAAGCEVVLHTAAVVSNTVDAATQWRVNVLGTRRVVEVARDAGVARLVLFSSVRAFGDAGFPDGVTEDWPVRPDGNPYVDTKIAAENVVLQADAAGELTCTVVRPADVYGPGSRPWTLLPLEIARSGRLVLPARGRGVFSPVYVDDLVDGVLRAATVPAAAGQVLTLPGVRAVTCEEFFGHYVRMLGGTRVRSLPTGPAAALADVAGRVERLRGRESELCAASARYLARTGTYSGAKAERLLGYRPRVDLDEGMARTERWLREQHLL